jgi:S1-C subfamily serine protease
LLDAGGRLIGVNSISYFAEKTHGTLGFAIPVDLVARLYRNSFASAAPPR